MFTRKNIIIAIILAISLMIILALTIIFYRTPFDSLDYGRDMVGGVFINQKKDSILKRFGTPSRQWNGYYGLPDIRYTKKHGPPVTISYHRLMGIHFLTFEEINGEWVCWESLWVPRGIIID